MVQKICNKNQQKVFEKSKDDNNHECIWLFHIILGQKLSTS